MWDFFGFKKGNDGSPNEDGLPVCRLCIKTVSAKSSNTSTLFSHLKNNHPRQYAEIRSTSKSTSSGTNQAQPSIQEAIVSGQPYPKDSKRWQQVTNAVTYAIAKDCLPFRTVEKPGFTRLVSTLDRRYILPGRKHFSHTAIPSLYASTREKVYRELQEGVKFFSATTDLWSSESLHPYISYTIHYIDPLWQYRSICLQTAFLPSDHTGENLAEALETALNTWGLNANQQVCITTDSGANIVRACNILAWRRLSCFGHNLNLAVSKSIKDDPRISRALSLTHKIVSSFSTSWKRRRELNKVQVEKNLPQHSLISDCPTRWGSMESMISRFLEQEEAVRAVLSSDRKTTHLIPSWQDTEVLESISKALSPVAELTDLLSGEEHITISSIVPVLHNLISRILAKKDDDTSFDVLDFREIVD